MFPLAAIPLAAIFISPAWAQVTVAQCPAGFDWVRGTLAFSTLTVRTFFFVYPVRRTKTLWARIHALLVQSWMPRVAVSVSTSPVRAVLVVDEIFYLSPAEYTYPPLDSTQHYLPPRANNSGHVTCDCNTVMYRYELSSFEDYTGGNHSI